MGRFIKVYFPQEEQLSPCFLREAISRKCMSHLGPGTTGGFDEPSDEPGTCNAHPQSSCKALVNVRKRDSMLPSGKTQPGTQFEVSSCSQQEYLSKTSHSMTGLHIRQTQDKIVVRKLHAQCNVCATFLRTT